MQRHSHLQQPPWRVGVDVGGTFTDLVVADSGGRTDVFKVPSVPADPGQGVISALLLACETLKLSPEKFLGACQYFLHGSTVATNTLLEGKGATVGLLTTRGFRDSLEARRGLRKNPWDHRTPFPPVLVPRYLRLSVAGRIDADGKESEALQLDDVAAACEQFRSENVESVAICFLNSFVNNTHESQVAEYLRAQTAFEFLSVSSDIVPIMGEYERTSTTVVNAYVMPRVASYLTAMQHELRHLGLKTQLLMLQSNGGAASLDQLIRQPVNLLLSGPSAGVGAMTHLANGINERNLVSMEIGGTSCDVMLMHEGKVAITDSLSVNDYDLVTPSVDIHTVGAGGGTIAGIDAVGLIFAGPEGAGANPGPAAYGLGGKHPTVTDAHLVLGRLRAGPYAGGSVSLDLQAAQHAVDTTLAEPLGLNRTQAAIGIIRMVEQNLLHAVERISIQRGYNPGRFTLVACGGAGPMHGASVGRKLGAKSVYIPRQAGAFCAIGMQHADVRRDFVQVIMRELDDGIQSALITEYTALQQQADDALRNEGFDTDSTTHDYELDLHYEGQQWDVRISSNPQMNATDIRAAFESEYDRQFGHINPDSRINVAKLRVIGVGKLPPLEDPVYAQATHAAAPIETRDVYSQARQEFVNTPVYRGDDLSFGHSFDGPAIIEESTTTIVVDAGDRVSVDALNNYVISLNEY